MKYSGLWRALPLLLMMGSTCPAAPPAVTAPAHQIPRIVGLAVTKAVSEPRGDYETVQVVAQLDADSMVLVRSGEAPDDAGEVREFSITREVSMKDLRGARVVRSYFHTSEFKTFPGTSPVPTAVMINELRATGRTHITHLVVEPQFGMTVVASKLAGDLVRVGAGPVDLPVLVNGQRIALRTLHVKGHLVDGDEANDFEYFLLDDPDNPLFLQSRSSLGTSNVVKIEFPVPPAAADSMEQQLKKNRKALVYGIYFSFASAGIRPVSERVLKEIAQVMKSNPDWKLRIDGHTDNIGGDKSNLELSRRRAASVMDALVRRYGIAAARLSSGGYGASQPQEKNDTPEGRARNRRVELTRE